MTLDSTTLLVLASAVLLTAALSCVATLAVASRVIRRRYVPRIQREVEGALARLGDVVEQRVQQGVVQGVKSLPSAELVRWTREAVTDAASDLVRGGLSSLLGDGPKKK